jgi:hypothetical protein
MAKVWQSLSVIYTWGGEAHETRGVSQQFSMSCAAVRAGLRSFQQCFGGKNIVAFDAKVWSTAY